MLAVALLTLTLGRSWLGLCGYSGLCQPCSGLRESFVGARGGKPGRAGSMRGHVPHCSTPALHSPTAGRMRRGHGGNELDSKLQQKKLFQTAIITHQHVFYFRVNQVPQSAWLPHPPHPTEIQPSLICFPASGAERRVGIWASSPLLSEPSLPCLRHRGLQQDGSSDCQAPIPAALAQPDPQLMGDTGRLSRRLAGDMAGVWGSQAGMAPLP